MKNSVAIVTGASQGIGRSTAIRLARDFSSVVLVARNGADLNAVAGEVRKHGGEPLAIALDLSQVESPETVVKTTLDRYGRIDALLNIAGAVPQVDLFEMTDEQWTAGMEVNSIIPGAVMTDRRRSFLAKWAPAHNMSVEEATKKFPEEAGISRYGQPEEIAELLGFMVSPAAKWMTGTSVRMDGGETKGI